MSPGASPKRVGRWRRRFQRLRIVWEHAILPGLRWVWVGTGEHVLMCSFGTVRSITSVDRKHPLYKVESIYGSHNLNIPNLEYIDPKKLETDLDSKKSARETDPGLH